MFRDLEELDAILRRIRERVDRWCHFPNMLDALDQLENDAMRVTLAWVGSGYSQMGSQPHANGKATLRGVDRKQRSKAFVALVRSMAGRDPTPAEVARAAIAYRLETPCRDEEGQSDITQWKALCKKWGKYTRKGGRALRGEPTEAA